MSKSKKTESGKTGSQKIDKAQAEGKAPLGQGELEEMQEFFQVYHAYKRSKEQSASKPTPKDQSDNGDKSRYFKENHSSNPAQQTTDSEIANPSQKEPKPSLSRERWLRVGKRRGEAVLYALNQLSKCANSYNYQYTSEEIDHIFEKVNKKLQEVQQSFKYRLPKSDSDDSINF